MEKDQKMVQMVTSMDGRSKNGGRNKEKVKKLAR